MNVCMCRYKEAAEQLLVAEELVPNAEQVEKERRSLDIPCVMCHPCLCIPCVLPVPFKRYYYYYYYYYYYDDDD